MVQSKGIGMVFDGEGLAYYYKDLEKASWWKSQQANWNIALSQAITANKGYIEAKVSDFCIKNTCFIESIRKRTEVRIFGMTKSEHSMITCSTTTKKHASLLKSLLNGHQLATKENSIMVFSSQKLKCSLQIKFKLLPMVLPKIKPSFKVNPRTNF